MLLALPPPAEVVAGETWVDAVACKAGLPGEDGSNEPLRAVEDSDVVGGPVSPGAKACSAQFGQSLPACDGSKHHQQTCLKLQGSCTHFYFLENA